MAQLDLFMFPLRDRTGNDARLVVDFRRVMVGFDIFVQRFMDGFGLGRGVGVRHGFTDGVGMIAATDAALRQTNPRLLPAVFQWVGQQINALQHAKWKGRSRG